MLSAILSEKKYETKFITTATARAIIIPFCPPKARPIIISSRVSAVSKNAVLNVFPIEWLFPSYWMLRLPPGCKELKHGEVVYFFQLTNLQQLYRPNSGGDCGKGGEKWRGVKYLP